MYILLSTAPENQTDNNGSSIIHTSNWWWWLFSPLLVLILVFVATSFLITQYRLKFKLKSEEINAFLFGSENEHEETIGGNYEAFRLKYDKEKYEIPESNYTLGKITHIQVQVIITPVLLKLIMQFMLLDKSKCLGSGEFGIVYYGVIVIDHGEISTAIKTTKQVPLRHSVSRGYSSSLTSLLGEIKLLAYLGNHKNIVRMFGANTEELDAGKVLVFLELCENGSLLKHLRSLNPVQYLPQADQLPGGDLEAENVPLTFQLEYELAQCLLKWANEIANGMEYLASKRVRKISSHDALQVPAYSIDDAFNYRLSMLTLRLAIFCWIRSLLQKFRTSDYPGVFMSTRSMLRKVRNRFLGGGWLQSACKGWNLEKRVTFGPMELRCGRYIHLGIFRTAVCRGMWILFQS